MEWESGSLSFRRKKFFSSCSGSRLASWRRPRRSGRIVKTMGFRLAKLRPWQGFAAETSAAIVVGGASLMGFPLSTSQTVSGSIMGVSASKGAHSVNMGIVREILFGWILTVPISMALGYLAYLAVGAFL
jgi:PiT family inorganic phosphate transporter